MSLPRRPWTEDDARRHMELGRIFGVDRHGSIEGVEFDLRHPLIDPKEWSANVVGAAGLITFRSDFEPFLWFPWMGKFDAEALESELRKDEQRAGRAHDKRHFRWLARSLTPEHFVYAGDKLIVVRVERESIGGTFEHPHDNEMRLAYLHIQRANGKVEKVKTPLTFTGNLTLFAPRASRQYFEAISRRILDHFGLSQLSEVKSFPEQELAVGGYAIAALERAFSLEKRTEKARRLDYFGSWKTSEERDASDKVHLLNDAVALGYIWAKAEDEMGMQPLAVSALRAKLGGATGGRKSGEARRLKRATTWERHARELASEIRAEQSELSQENVANEVMWRWREAAFSHPGHKEIKRLISAMENAGELPRRTAPPRKKRE